MNPKRMRKPMILLGSLATFLILTAESCDSATKANTVEKQQQQAGSEAIVNAQPLPAITYSQLRQNLIEIEQAQSTPTATTSFFFNQGVPNPITKCPSIGFPIPNTASLSNPTQVIYTGSGGAVATGDQMDPNGIYTPTNSTGTTVICLDADGLGYGTYWEGFVATVTGPAHWDSDKHEIVLDGAPTAKFTVKGK